VISPHPVDRLIEQDTFAEMLALLEPAELLIACLRLEDLSHEQIASLLDIRHCLSWPLCLVDGASHPSAAGDRSKGAGSVRPLVASLT
jgi:hypothetical protein